MLTMCTVLAGARSGNNVAGYCVIIAGLVVCNHGGRGGTRVAFWYTARVIMVVLWFDGGGVCV